jgi:hypothetical protein
MIEREVMVQAQKKIGHDGRSKRADQDEALCE